MRKSAIYGTGSGINCRVSARGYRRSCGKGRRAAKAAPGRRSLQRAPQRIRAPARADSEAGAGPAAQAPLLFIPLLSIRSLLSPASLWPLLAKVDRSRWPKRAGPARERTRRPTRQDTKIAGVPDAGTHRRAPGPDGRPPPAGDGRPPRPPRRSEADELDNGAAAEPIEVDGHWPMARRASATGMLSEEPSSIARRCECALRVSSSHQAERTAGSLMSHRLAMTRFLSSSGCGRRSRSLCKYGCPRGANLRRNWRKS